MNHDKFPAPATPKFYSFARIVSNASFNFSLNTFF